MRRWICQGALTILVLGATGAVVARPVQADTVPVAIASFRYNPESISVSVGSTVTWTNSDSATHTVTNDPGSAVAFDGRVPNGQSFSFTFNQAGTFPYHCTIHPTMKGSVIVNGPAAQATGTSVPSVTPAPTSAPPATAAPTSTVAPTATAVPTATATPTAAPTPAPSGKKAKTVQAVEVSKQYRYKPVTLKVKVGTKVTWKNGTDAPHTVTSKTKGWTMNGKLAVKKSISFTFKKAGTFNYVCTYHTGMVGTVKVSK